MVVIVKYFHENDATEFNALIRTHDERIIFLHHHLSFKTQLRLIINDLGNETRDILVVRFPKVKSPVATNFFKSFQRSSQLENCCFKYEYLTFQPIGL